MTQKSAKARQIRARRNRNANLPPPPPPPPPQPQSQPPSNYYNLVVSFYGQEVPANRVRTESRSGVRAVKLNNVYRQVIQTDVSVETSTPHNLLAKYHPGQLIRIYERVKDENNQWVYPAGGDRTPEFLRFMKTINPAYEVYDISFGKNMLYEIALRNSETTGAVYLRIDSISPDLANAPIPASSRRRNRRYADYTDNRYLYHKYVSNPLSLTDMFHAPYDRTYIRTNNLKGGCGIDVLLRRFATPWNAHQAKLKKPNLLTKQHLIAHFQATPPLYAVSLDQMLAIAKFGPFPESTNNFTFTLNIHDVFRKTIAHHFTSCHRRDVKQLPTFLDLIAFQGHLYEMNVNLKSLHRKLKDDDTLQEWDLESRLSNKYYIPSKPKPDDEPIALFLNHITELPQHKLEENKTYNISIEQPPLRQVLEALTSIPYIPGVTRHQRDVLSSLHATVNNATLRITNPNDNKVTEHIGFSSAEQFYKHRYFSQKLSSALITPDLCSSYAPNTLTNFFNTAPKALTGLLDNNYTPNHEIDISKQYLSAMLKLPFFHVLNEFDYFRPYDNAPLDPTFFYTLTTTAPLTSIPARIRVFLDSQITTWPGHILLHQYTYHISTTTTENTHYHKTETYTILDHLAPWATITHYLTVSKTDKITPSLFHKIIKELYQDQLLTTSQKKDIFNVYSGRLEQVEQRIDKSQLSNDQLEAIELGQQANARVYALPSLYTTNPEDSIHRLSSESPPQFTPLYLITKSHATDLTTGFYPMKASIYAQARLNMLALYDHATYHNYLPTHIKTDAFLFYHPNPILKRSDNSFFSIGEYTVKKIVTHGYYNTHTNTYMKQTFIPQSYLKDRTPFDRNHSIHRNPQPFQSQDIPLLLHPPTQRPYIISYIHQPTIITNPPEEHLFNHPTESYQYRRAIVNYFDQHQYTTVTGTLPGTGKTEAIYIYAKCRALTHRIMVVAPTNKRLRALMQRLPPWIRFDTCHKLLGLRPDTKETIDQPTVADLSKIDILIVDEFLLLKTKQIARFRKLIATYPTLKIIATMDPLQQTFLDVNIKDTPAFLNFCVETIFPHGLQLTINKRFPASEVSTLLTIKHSLITNRDKSSYLSHVHQLTTKSEYLDLLTNHNGIAIAYTQNNRRCINDHAHEHYIASRSLRRHTTLLASNHYFLIGLYKVFKNQLLTVKTRLDRKGISSLIHTNEQVVVHSVSDPLKTLYVHRPNDPTLITLPFDLFDTFNHLEYSYCDTAVQTQGDTYKNRPVILFDTNHFHMTTNAIWTSLTRANTLANVYVYTGKQDYSIELINYKQQVHKRIVQHQQEDRKAKRQHSECITDYIDFTWIDQQLSNPNLACFHCQTPLIADLTDQDCISIDRMDDSKPHLKSNCVISCRPCNCGHQNRHAT